MNYEIGGWRAYSKKKNCSAPNIAPHTYLLNSCLLYYGAAVPAAIRGMLVATTVRRWMPSRVHRSWIQRDTFRLVNVGMRSWDSPTISVQGGGGSFRRIFFNYASPCFNLSVQAPGAPDTRHVISRYNVGLQADGGIPSRSWLQYVANFTTLQHFSAPRRPRSIWRQSKVQYTLLIALVDTVSIRTAAYFAVIML